ncbi:MAG: DinB family protein [Flavisolibacter sp.]
MLNQSFIAELNHEGASTKRILERVPDGKFDWKPHEKSMTLGRLASHVAELPGFLNSILTMDEFDFAKGHYKASHAKTSEELMKVFQEKLNEAVQTLQHTSDEKMQANFTLRSGDHVIATIPRLVAIRSMALNHIIHHRGQLAVYLRLLDVPVPGLYGPSADEM